MSAMVAVMVTAAIDTKNPVELKESESAEASRNDGTYLLMR